MTSYSVTRDITADPGTIWAILTDPAQLVPDFGILRLEGTMGPGARIKLWSELDPKRAFALRVTDWVPNKRMVWQGGMPFGLFRGTRTFDLVPNGTGTRFTMDERFTGPLAGLIIKSIPDLQPSFDKFGDALKRKAEA